MDDPKPLGEWVIELALRSEYHFNTQDLEEMDVEKYHFILGYMNAVREEQKQHQLELEKKMKHSRKGR